MNKREKTYLLYFVILFFVSCQNELAKVMVVAEMNKRVIVSEKCDKVIYCSNQENYFAPYLIDHAFSTNPTTNIIRTDAKRDFFPKSISFDCQFVSMVSETNDKRTFDVFLYELRTKKLVNITHSDEIDDGEAYFSPVSSYLAFLSDSRLQIYDFEKSAMELINNPWKVFFKSLIWSAKGNYIFLEDDSTNIWRFSLVNKQFSKVWKAPKLCFTPRMLTPSVGIDSIFYFISDHQSNFTQIYKYTTVDSCELFIESNHDKYLLERPLSESEFFFRENLKGNFLLRKFSDGKIEAFGPKDGVVYYYYHNLRGSYILYADDTTPTSLFLKRGEMLRNVGNIQDEDALPAPAIHINSEGMLNLVYQSPYKQKGWIVWLHGGPYEQMSNRYNTYLVNLLRNGWNIIAVNYPGSTGVGNQYELRNATASESLSKQVSTIRRDLVSLMRIYPTLKKYCLIAVSYGSIPAYEYVNSYSNEIIALVDFSGIATVSYSLQVPLLYIYGAYDFSLDNPSRTQMIDGNLSKRTCEQFVLYDEGHVINHKNNIESIIRKINVFLTIYSKKEK